MRCALRGLYLTKLRPMKTSRTFLSWQACLLTISRFALSMKQTAVIKETLRIAISVPASLPRVVPPSGAVISGVSIPGGVGVSCPSVFCYSFLMSLQTVVSQCVPYVSFSEEIFARPHDFLPDRWLQPESKALESWLVAFSKGPRSCLGIK